MASIDETKSASPHVHGVNNLLWKVNDKKSLKSGPHNSVFWVKSNPRFEQAKKEGDANKERFSKFRTGNKYAGEWENNKKQGFGTQEWSCGTKYEGDWFNGQRSGRGTLWKTKKSDGGKRGVAKEYTGTWEMNKRHGTGTNFYAKFKHYPSNDLEEEVEGAARYEGEWEHDMRHGQGEMFFPNGDRYEGSWKNDKRNGIGRFTAAHGDVYQGSWSDDLKHGVGCFLYAATGKVYEGEWHEGTPTCGEYKNLSSLDSELAQALVDGLEIFEPSHNFSLPLLGLKDPDVVLSTILSRESRKHK